MSEATERKAFKLWFDAALVADLSDRLRRADPRFDARRFRAKARRGLDELEMMDRVGQIADALHEALPRPTKAALAALTRSLPEALTDAQGVTEKGYRFWPYGEYIARYGLDDVDASFAAMVQLTMRFSAEFAVRPFFEADVDGMLDRLEGLVKHANPHVRRWVSEGTRSRLPWGKKSPALESRLKRRLKLLSALRQDPDPYVQKSVANHLQDILKDDLDAGFPVLAAWSRQKGEGIAFITRHAARGLLKAGHAPTLELFGLRPTKLDVSPLSVRPKRVTIGESVDLKTRLRHSETRAVTLRVDYAWISPTKTGRTARKVFRWADRVLAPNEDLVLEKRHPFVHRTIRTIVPGKHSFEILINGQSYGAATLRVE